ncbi:MAG: hypothetical protein JWM57_3435 [Phycisphaerales bacterium]|nr:hypothetical protein [Phycisphaerales bacterium]
MEVANLIEMPPAPQPARPTFRPLPPIERFEPRALRIFAAVLACAIAVAYFWFILQYWAPSHPGVDQNGYLVGGKQLAWTGSTGMKPDEPLGFVSNMWVLNPETGVNYPKYPVGLPLLYAIVLWTCGAAGPKAAFLVSPTGAASAVLGMYFLARRFAGPFASLMAMLLLAFSPVTLVLADNPNSHASCLAFCVWGAFMLVRFWETGSIWRGIVGGFLLGFAATIRYTEGLLGLMIGLAVLSFIVSHRWRAISIAACVWCAMYVVLMHPEKFAVVAYAFGTAASGIAAHPVIASISVAAVIAGIVSAIGMASIGPIISHHWRAICLASIACWALLFVLMFPEKLAVGAYFTNKAWPWITGHPLIVLISLAVILLAFTVWELAAEYRRDAAFLTDWRTPLRLASPVLGWLIPMIWLLGFNRIAMGTWTGYDTTNESVPGSAFTFDHVADNWELFFRKVHDTGLFFTLPLGLLGMCLALRTGMRRASLLWLWLVPGTGVYLSYYWAPERGMSYLRFFLTLLPPLVIGTAVVIDLVIASATTRFGKIVSPLMGGVIVAIACGMNLYRGQLGLEDGQETGVGMESQFRQQMNLAALANVVTTTVPKGSVLLSQSAQLNDLQFVGDYDCFATEYFTAANATRLKSQKDRLDPDDPDPIQPARRDYLYELTKDKSDDQLAQMQTDLIRRSIAAGKRVFLLASRTQSPSLTKRYEKADIGLTWAVRARYHDLPRLNAGDDPVPPAADPRGRRGGFGGFGGFGGPNARGGVRGQRAGNSPFREAVQQWQIIEITRRPERPAEPKPAPKPAAKPATPPPAAVKPAAPKPVEAKPVAPKPPEPKAAEPKAAAPKPVEPKAAEPKPADVKSAAVVPAALVTPPAAPPPAPAGIKSADPVVGPKSPTTKPAEVKPTEPPPAPAAVR